MSDLISRAVLLEKLMPDTDRIFPDPMTDTATRYQIIQLIKAIPSAEQWIPCSERNPDHENRVLVCTQYGDVYTARYTYSLFYNRNMWVENFSGQELVNVTWWTPLPKLPKIGGEEK